MKKTGRLFGILADKRNILFEQFAILEHFTDFVKFQLGLYCFCGKFTRLLFEINPLI